MSVEAAEETRRSHGLRVATFGGVPVYIGRSWPIIALVVVLSFGPQVRYARPDLGSTAYLIAVAYAVLLLFSVLAHEAAHAVVAHRFGYAVSRVVADLWGGHTAYDSSGQESGDSAGAAPARSALVAVAGPAANGALAVLAIAVHSTLEPSGTPALLVGAVGYTNGLVAVFNLLPGLPLDGGFLVEALVWRLTGSRETGLIAAGWCGRVVTVLVLLASFAVPFLRGGLPSVWTVVWALFIATFLWSGASGAIRTGKARRLLASITVRSVWRPALNVPERATVAEAVAHAWAHTVAPAPASPPTIDERARPGGSSDRLTLVVVDADLRPVGVVDEDAVRAMPQDVRQAAPVSSVLRRQPAGWVVDADPDGPITDVVVRMQEKSLAEVAVRGAAGSVLGVVVAADLYAAV